MTVDSLEGFADSAPLGCRDRDDRWVPALGTRRKCQQASKLSGRSVRSWKIDLIDDENICDLEHARFERLHRVAETRYLNENDRIHEPDDLDFFLAYPNRFDDYDIETCRVEQVNQLSCGRSEAA